MRLLSMLILLGSLSLHGCTNMQHNAVGWFDDYNEALVGEVSSNLMTGTSVITVSSPKSGLTCSGTAITNEVPNPMSLSCAGQRGYADLTCSDGREVRVNYTLTSCTSGQGTGKDQDGNTLTVKFGMTKEQADAAIKQAERIVASKPDLPKVYEPGKVREEKGAAIGTGFFVSPNGIIVTNHHVIDGASKITVVDTFTGRKGEARVLYKNSENDIAIIKVNASNIPYLRLRNNSTLRKGDDIIALGYPDPLNLGQELKATFGRINSLSGGDGEERFYQIDASIQPGNSGGPLLDAHGEVVGVNTATYSPMYALIENGYLPQNINYAVKMQYAIPALRNVLANHGLQLPMGTGATYPTVADAVSATERAVVLIITE